MSTSELLDTMVGASSAFLLGVLVLSAFYLILGLAKPEWGWAASRGSVVLRALGAVLIGLAAHVGVIAYTHSHPEGPHSAERYIREYGEALRRERESPSAPASEDAGANPPAD